MFDGGFSLGLLQRLNQDGAALPQTGEASVEAAWKRLRAGPWPMELARLRRRNGTVYRPVSLVDRLLERCTNRILASRLEVRQANRDKIVSDLATLLRESTPLRIYRFDIKSFYESIDTQALLAGLHGQWNVPRSAIHVVASAFDAASRLGATGVPRGFSISATLAEDYLRSFDEAVGRQPNVYFYGRFVDDAIVLTTGHEQSSALVAAVDAALQSLSLRRNERKQRIVDWELGQTFDYLGYQFTHAGGGARKEPCALEIDIATSKVRRFKTKICLALRDHDARPNLDLLKDRLRVLSGNYVVGRRSKHQALRAGIYYSYKAVNQLSALRALDRFLRTILFATSLPISQAAQRALTTQERRSLVRVSFEAGHTNRLMCKFDRSRMNELRRCWSHV